MLGYTSEECASYYDLVHAYWACIHEVPLDNPGEPLGGCLSMCDDTVTGGSADYHACVSSCLFVGGAVTGGASKLVAAGAIGVGFATILAALIAL